MSGARAGRTKAMLARASKTRHAIHRALLAVPHGLNVAQVHEAIKNVGYPRESLAWMLRTMAGNKLIRVTGKGKTTRYHALRNAAAPPAKARANGGSAPHVTAVEVLTTDLLRVYLVKATGHVRLELGGMKIEIGVI